MNDNLPLFDDDHAELGLLLDRIDAIPFGELHARWPQLLADMIDLFCAELQRQGHDEVAARLSASKLVGALAHYYGGRAVYLPILSIQSHWMTPAMTGCIGVSARYQNRTGHRRKRMSGKPTCSKIPPRKKMRWRNITVCRSKAPVPTFPAY